MSRVINGNQKDDASARIDGVLVKMRMKGELEEDDEEMRMMTLMRCKPV